MRIEIKTKGKVTDPDVRALYTLVYALDNSTSRMFAVGIGVKMRANYPVAIMSRGEQAHPMW